MVGCKRGLDRHWAGLDGDDMAAAPLFLVLAIAPRWNSSGFVQELREAASSDPQL